MTVTRRHFACAALAVAAALPFASLAQGAYPSKPISVVVGYPPAATPTPSRACSPTSCPSA
jgi:tripartite-type tricarboxylate transporter receptor subunit TctC